MNMCCFHWRSSRQSPVVQINPEKVQLELADLYRKQSIVMQAREALLKQAREARANKDQLLLIGFRLQEKERKHNHLTRLISRRHKLLTIRQEFDHSAENAQDVKTYEAVLPADSDVDELKDQTDKAIEADDDIRELMQDVVDAAPKSTDATDDNEVIEWVESLINQPVSIVVTPPPTAPPLAPPPPPPPRVMMGEEEEEQQQLLADIEQSSLLVVS